MDIGDTLVILDKTQSGSDQPQEKEDPVSQTPETKDGSEPSSAFQDLHSSFEDDKRITGDTRGNTLQEKEPDWARVLSTIFNGTPKEQIERVGKYWAFEKQEGRYPSSSDGDGETFIVVPKVPNLPPHLVPWEGLFSDWAKKTDAGRDRRKLPPSLRNTALWGVSGPKLPYDAEPWIITLGVDSGPMRGELGFTTPLLVAAPFDWFPGTKEVTLFGSMGEMLVHRCDGTTMRIPREWWDRWAYGAMASGALYYVLP